MSESVRPGAGGLAERLTAVQGGIVAAAAAAGRDPAELTTIVVTKFQPVSLLQELAALGVRNFGESRHQEAQAKAAELLQLDLTWHFVGQVQGKKARQVRAYADVIHSVDRASLVDALASEDSVVDCFVQVNLTDDPSRGGVAPGELPKLVEHVLSTAGLRLIGLMAVAPLGAEPRPSFARVRELGEQIQQFAPNAKSLSMGMSQDYAEAIIEGATHLRIGTAITGNRPVSG
ncbi:YggS family pyridoxal phosphate-dependent enzyme [Cryobacterium sp. TMT1-19]|uniref:Pyridoxal phosphate homeostasis protein n=1 Tax=Cryobacterium sandaracinum TaxID=1259247 RepID=A0ABY2JFC5_9MICO|nr:MULTISPECIES: YggS family pyridoxal phosphate-dependent enzyme [Cryobacterium]TFB59547.1 YggS family pyridoxal phosphate-dependent enzyme [Cryobacterium sp. Hz7]TFB60448.1 YggS family pyridoxal phosphate-dependent enzyme [Cryobacterium sp. Sr3]TFC38940.1 YggS family pyridoxal phosphate-dependent enzyme [Cryobacterium sp. TMT2-14]TFC54297.1 YggS family pyridoxal phosphate-dependent enzyme [Cryobacterium sp. TMT2-17-1]TFD04488.1 YggS family pyridoxal phosphate-dependent enzyme [Cryobacterium 